MHTSNTIVALRRGAYTIVASSGLRSSPAGLVLRHKSNLVSRVFEDKVIFASNAPEACSVLLNDYLDKELRNADGELRRAALALSRTMAGHRLLRNTHVEGILASKDFLALLTSNGEMVEPEEGFLAVGTSAQIASGAMKALLIHSTLSTEQIVRESLRIAGELNHHRHDEMSLEFL